MMKPFLSALAYPFRGVGYFLARPALWKYFAGAFAINLVLFAILAWLFVHYRVRLVDWITPDWFWTWAQVAIGWIFTVIVAILGLFLFTIVGNLLAAPFLDAMTERILTELGETLPPSRGPLRALLRALRNQSIKLAFFGAIQLLLLLLWIIPVVGFLHPPLSAILTILFLGFEYADYPLDARQMPIPRRFEWMFAHLGSTLGFGLVLFPLFLIPLVGYLCLPLAVAGASLLVHNIDSSEVRR
jgi:CysZ protein